MRDRARHATLIGVGTIAQVVLDGRAGVSGSPVDTWTGRPGTSTNATGSGAARPTTTTLNGQPALLFDGVDDLLDMTATAAGVFRNRSYGLIITVVGVNSTTPNDQIAVVFQSSFAAARVACSCVVAGAAVTRAGGRRLDADSFAASGLIGSTLTGAIMDSEFNWGANSISARVNGVSSTAGSFSSGAGSTSNTDSIGAFIGAAGPSTLPANGLIAAVIATNQSWSTSLASLVRTCLSRSFLIPLEA